MASRRLLKQTDGWIKQFKIEPISSDQTALTLTIPFASENYHIAPMPVNYNNNYTYSCRIGFASVTSTGFKVILYNDRTNTFRYVAEGY